MNIISIQNLDKFEKCFRNMKLADIAERMITQNKQAEKIVRMKRVFKRIYRKKGINQGFSHVSWASLTKQGKPSKKMQAQWKCKLDWKK